MGGGSRSVVASWSPAHFGVDASADISFYFFWFELPSEVWCTPDLTGDGLLLNLCVGFIAQYVFCRSYISICKYYS